MENNFPATEETEIRELIHSGFRVFVLYMEGLEKLFPISAYH